MLIGALVLGYLIGGSFTAALAKSWDMDNGDHIMGAIACAALWPAVLPAVLGMRLRKWWDDPARLEAKAAKRLAGVVDHGPKSESPHR